MSFDRFPNGQECPTSDAVFISHNSKPTGLESSLTNPSCIAEELSTLTRVFYFLPNLPGHEVFSHIPCIFICFVPTVTSAFHVHHRQELRAYRRKRFCCLWVDLGFTPKHKPQMVSSTQLPPVWLDPTSTARIESQPRAYRPGAELHFRTASYLGPL